MFRSQRRPSRTRARKRPGDEWPLHEDERRAAVRVRRCVPEGALKPTHVVQLGRGGASSRCGRPRPFVLLVRAPKHEREYAANAHTNRSGSRSPWSPVMLDLLVPPGIVLMYAVLRGNGMYYGTARPPRHLSRSEVAPVGIPSLARPPASASSQARVSWDRQRFSIMSH